MNGLHEIRILSLPLNSTSHPHLCIHTHSLISHRCVGTIKQYYAASNVHLVVFDEPYLQPQWVKAVTEDVDILLGSEEMGGTGQISFFYFFFLHLFLSSVLAFFLLTFREFFSIFIFDLLTCSICYLLHFMIFSIPICFYFYRWYLT